MEKPSQPFEVLRTSLLVRIEETTGVTKKKEALDDFLQGWRMQYGLDYYDVLCLLMPIYSGRMYGLKEISLANVFIKALAMPPNSADAMYLKNYKKPQPDNRVVGVFHKAVEFVVKKRSTVTSSTKTVHDVNMLLNDLCRDDGTDDEIITETVLQKQVNIAKHMIDNYTPAQIGWIVRIILKDLNFRLSEQSVLSVVHQNAKELYDTGRSLVDLCKFIQDPRAIESSFNGVKLFSPCLPQLGYKFVSASQDTSFEKLSKPFYVEQKLDGERMLMHYDPDTDKFMWFSRKKSDYSKRYGTTSQNNAKLTGRIYRGLPKRSVILDGEMVAYDPVFKGFLPFGTLKSTSINNEGQEMDGVQTNVDINDPTKAHPCYIVFDIIFYDGKSLINNPLEERINLLNLVIQTQNQHLMLMTRQTMSTMEEVALALDEAVKKQQEGLVLKDPKSKYVLNSRLYSWIKIKPEFMDALKENCDVAIIGVKYGSGTYGGVYRQILCAVLDDTGPGPANNDPKFYTFAMIHSGLKDKDVATLNYAGQGEKFVPGQVPAWISHPLNSNEKPDKWLYYENALIAEIKGSEIIPSTQFGLANTLRFPRLVRYRHDKTWKDIMTLSEFKKMQSDKRRGQKREADEQVNLEKKTRKKAYTLLSSQQGADVSDITVESKLFEGLVFYVMNGTKQFRKGDIEEMIHRHSGRFVQDRRMPGVIVIGSDEDIIPHRLRLIHQEKLCDVRRAQWVVDSIKLQDVLLLEPKYMYVTLDETRAEFLQRMDIYGDPYTKFLNDEQTKELLERMGKDESESDGDRRKICQRVMEECFSDHHMTGFLFVNVVAYFYFDTSMSLNEPPLQKTIRWIKWKKLYEKMQVYKDRFKFEMGDVRYSNRDQEVTHVIINQNDLSHLGLLKNEFHRPRLPRFVTMEWIQACIDNRTIVNELDYLPKIPIEL